MTWVPPFFTCGACGGEIGRYPMVNLLRQQILDWRHRTVPEGVTPHRAVLGTPVPALDLAVAEEAPAEVPVEIPDPEVPARPAIRDELPTSARRLDDLAVRNGWLTEAWYLRGPWLDARWHVSRIVETLVLRLVRDGHGLVAIWDSPVGAEPDWSFTEGFSVTHYTEPCSSPQMRKIIEFPRMVCETCGEGLTLHQVVPGGFLCHAEFLARQQKEAA